MTDGAQDAGGAVLTAARRYDQLFPAGLDQVCEARRFAASVLDGCPAADDAVLCVSELAANACLHSASRRPGGTVRAASAALGPRGRDHRCPYACPGR